MVLDQTSVALVDTSAAVALVVADHAAHGGTWEALSKRQLGLAGHAWFETYSVLTRLPGPNRRDASTVATLLTANFPHTRFLDDKATERLTQLLSGLGVSGGAVYDALVASAAIQHDLVLISRDPRACDTYRSVGAEVEFLE